MKDNLKGSVLSKMYSALDISECIVKYCNALNFPITNLELQRLLYYVQGYSFALRGTAAFNDELETWGLGVRVKPIYEFFSRFASTPLNFFINECNEIKESELNLIILTVIFNKHINSFFDLWTDKIDAIKNEEPYKYTYQVFGNYQVIPKEFIKSCFVEKRNMILRNIYTLINKVENNGLSSY